MFGLISTIAGLGFIAYMAREHINTGGKITVGGVIVIMILAVAWVAEVDENVSCDNGNQTACERIQQYQDHDE